MAPRIPILLTSSVIAYDTGVALSDTQERTHLALESVAQWLAIAPKSPIVLCDGSNFDFAPQVAQQFPNANIECLAFENPQDLVRQHGRGYGEGEIVRHAITHSQRIKEAGCFAKCSSKLWVDNYHDCIAAWNANLLCKAVFLDAFSLTRPTRLAYVDTRFYVASVQTYVQHFVVAHHNIHKENGHGLEECFRDALVGDRLDHCLFTVQPVISGVGGGTGTSYKNSTLRRLKESLRLWLVSKHPRFAHLFAT
jgi:hypothetical protein